MRARREDGAAAVEFALILPVFLALLLGMIDFGFAFNAKIGITQAAREGARVVALGGDAGAMQTRVDEALATNGQIDDLSVQLVAGCASGATGAAHVRVTGSVATLLPIDDIELTSEGVMQCAG